MKKFTMKMKEQTLRIPVEQYNSITRETIFSQSEYDDGLRSICLGCPNPPCMHFSEEEAPFAMINSRSICPVDAMSLNPDHNIVEINDSCIKCGLCLFRCPFGAIYIDEKNGFCVNNNIEGYKESDEKDFQEYKESLEYNLHCDTKEIERILPQFKDEIIGSKEDIFYPLTTKYLTYIGLPSEPTRRGDTNDRTDAKIFNDAFIIPIEIKSPTESMEIPPKAIRQALENKIIIMSRNKDIKTDREITSLAIGFSIPNSRSDIFESINNISNTYNMNIGLISIFDLLRMSWMSFLGMELDLDLILYLRGPIDEEIYNEER